VHQKNPAKGQVGDTSPRSASSAGFLFRKRDVIRNRDNRYHDNKLDEDDAVQ
jgi:hypothetical protein